jgi:ABC-type dipeptide/oligopeptide/nickel transport system permease subunit
LPETGTLLRPSAVVELDAPLVGAARSPAREAARAIARNRVALVSAAVIVLIAAAALVAPLIQRYPPDAMMFPPLEGPSSSHWFGTDHLGRDLWSRVVHGARISLVVGLGSQAIALTIGVLVGAVAGFSRRSVDSTTMRITDVMQALPSILLALLFLTVLGRSTPVLVLAIGLATWAVIARVVRAQVLAEKQQQYVEAAYSLGCGSPRVLLRHVFPNITGAVIVVVTFAIPQAIFAEAFLSYIGLGPPPPNPSWGRLLADGFPYVQTAPHYLVFPTVALSLTLLAFNFFGDGLRDAFDPHSTR